MEYDVDEINKSASPDRVENNVMCRPIIIMFIDTLITFDGCLQAAELSTSQSF